MREHFPTPVTRDCAPPSWEEARNRRTLSLRTFVMIMPKPIKHGSLEGIRNPERLRIIRERERESNTMNVFPTPKTNGLSGGTGADQKLKQLNQEGIITDIECQNMRRGWTGGLLNPDWVEWLMGWPIGWSALEPLETVRFPLAR